MQNFLFDLYGTLLDIQTDEQSEAFWKKIAKILKRPDEGGAVKERYLSLCERAKSCLPPGGEIDLSAVFTTLLTEYGLPASSRNVADFAAAFRKCSIRRFRLFRGALKLLKDLKEKGAKLYLLSNAQSCFTHAELRKSGLAPLFDGILLSSEVGWKKPSPHFFGTAFTRFHLDPERCLYVGNDLHDDVGGAHAAKMKCVYIPSPQSGSYSSAPVPDYSAKNRRELKKILLCECK